MSWLKKALWRDACSCRHTFNIPLLIEFIVYDMQDSGKPRGRYNSVLYNQVSWPPDVVAPWRVVALILLFDASAHVVIIDGVLLSNWLGRDS